MSETRTVPVADIAIGDRDREEMGNVPSLAASIAAVGLLHPVVVTGSLALVAGGRRLEAVKHLGWPEVPVTVVDLSNVAEVLRAEADENTERKPLTPYEASRARERRAQVLADDAAQRKAQAVGQPRGEKAQPVSSAKLAEETEAAPAQPAKPAQRETRKAAALGTGYSGSTLDKVDKIRDAAERGVAHVGSGPKRREVPVPEAVQAVAKRELDEVKKTGAAVDRAVKTVDGAIAAYLSGDQELARLNLRKEFLSAKAHAREITRLDAEQVAAALEGEDEWDDITRLGASLDDWFRHLSAARPKRLRLVKES